ncbi:hypothetical protein SGRA_0155 [Saprospira grandis str. Lewin]|uniref:Uncharacterized protein n=1 Tax=Saprospira grandis (strain Lewin) TaxID=984262 RepID=H6L527_SAPGL|nr:hypothetical protein SGRA_0155 [Saprospira grandis str. Lewin]
MLGLRLCRTAYHRLLPLVVELRPKGLVVAAQLSFFFGRFSSAAGQFWALRSNESEQGL